jgi:ABC-type lipoprotein release transport system permease subunit
MRAAFNYTDDYARGATVIDLHESLVGDARRSILVLYAAVAILGLIAVVNVGNLLLAHAAGRHREMAVRRALGAAKSVILRQLLVQSLVLAMAGGVIGAAVGVAGTEALRTLLAASLPRAAEIHLDVAVIAVTAIATIAAGSPRHRTRLVASVSTRTALRASVARRAATVPRGSAKPWSWRRCLWRRCSSSARR